VLRDPLDQAAILLRKRRFQPRFRGMAEKGPKSGGVGPPTRSGCAVAAFGERPGRLRFIPVLLGRRLGHVGRLRVGIRIEPRLVLELSALRGGKQFARPYLVRPICARRLGGRAAKRAPLFSSGERGDNPLGAAGHRMLYFAPAQRRLVDSGGSDNAFGASQMMLRLRSARPITVT